jgi:NADH-quinone oxidoreductase subunit C
MSTQLDNLKNALQLVLGEKIHSITDELGEITIVIKSSDYLSAMQDLRDHASTRFEQLLDLCGVDYSGYGDGAWHGARFAVVVHLLSVTHNWRLRVRTFATDDDLPVIPSVCPIWSSANWYEREAFDLFGILFEGHDDLRRLLTDLRTQRARAAKGHVVLRLQHHGSASEMNDVSEATLACQVPCLPQGVRRGVRQGRPGLGRAVERLHDSLGEEEVAEQRRHQQVLAKHSLESG